MECGTTMNMTIKDITNPFFSEIVKYIHKAANHSGYQIELCISNDDVNEEKGSFHERQTGWIWGDNQRECTRYGDCNFPDSELKRMQPDLQIQTAFQNAVKYLKGESVDELVNIPLKLITKK